MTECNTLTAFWSDFCRNHWESRPGQFPGFFSSPIASPTELFQACLDKSGAGASDRIWVASQDSYQKVDYSKFGPRTEDVDLDGFFERIDQNLKGRPFGLNRHALQLGSAELWFRFRQFLRDFHELLGLPTGRWDIDTFWGTYAATPFGIHVDNASVFAIGVKGYRTYYTWPRDYFEEDDPALHSPDPGVIDPHKAEAVRLELGPGDMVYWPSSHWHVVTSDGSPSAVIQLSCYFDFDLAQVVGNLCQRLVKTQADRFYGQGSDLPTCLAEAGRCVEESLGEQLETFWLKRYTADAFWQYPAMEPAGGLPSSLRLEERGRIAWRESGGGSLVGCNGHVLRSALKPADLEAGLRDIASLPAGLQTMLYRARGLRPDDKSSRADNCGLLREDVDLREMRRGWTRREERDGSPGR